MSAVGRRRAFAMTASPAGRLPADDIRNRAAVGSAFAPACAESREWSAPFPIRPASSPSMADARGRRRFRFPSSAPQGNSRNLGRVRPGSLGRRAAPRRPHGDRLRGRWRVPSAQPSIALRAPIRRRPRTPRRQVGAGRRLSTESGRAHVVAAIRSPIARHAVRPGDSIPNRLMSPRTPCSRSVWIRKSVEEPPGRAIFGRIPA